MDINKVNKKIMSYEEFLFSHLLVQIMKVSTPYDILYGEIPSLYKCFLESDENIEVRSEYDCMVTYIINNQTFLEHDLNNL